MFTQQSFNGKKHLLRYGNEDSPSLLNFDTKEQIDQAEKDLQKDTQYIVVKPGRPQDYIYFAGRKSGWTGTVGPYFSQDKEDAVKFPCKAAALRSVKHHRGNYKAIKL